METINWQLECHPRPAKSSISDQDGIAFLLADKKELGYGMHTYVLLNNLILLQNMILNELNRNQVPFIGSYQYSKCHNNHYGGWNSKKCKQTLSKICDSC